MDAYTKTLVRYMALKTGTELTPKHDRILQFAYTYYLNRKMGPLQQTIERETGIEKQELEKLFPQGLASIYSWLGIQVYAGQPICKQAIAIQVDDYREVYLDYGSTTFIRKEVADGLKSFFENPTLFGNPSSSHKLGKQAYQTLYQARSTIGNLLQVPKERLFFTGCGTEANNLVLKGVAFQKKAGHIIASRAEHASVLNPLKFLETLGFRVTYLDINREGIVEPQELKKHLAPDTILVALMAVNNEIGTLNPLAELGAICREAEVPFMVDAIQAFGKIPLKPTELGITYLTLSGHKIYAPKGIGCVYAEESAPLIPLLHGGEQESGLRSGTENVPYIDAFARAAKLLYDEMEAEQARLQEIQHYFLSKLRRVENRFIINGSLERKIPHILNIGFEGIDSGSLLLSLNHIGIYVSAGSACTAGHKESSHVLQALGVDTEKYGSIRFCFGMETKKEDIDYFIKSLPSILKQLRA